MINKCFILKKFILNNNFFLISFFFLLAIKASASFDESIIDFYDNYPESEPCSFERILASSYPISKSRIYKKIKLTKTNSEECKTKKASLLLELEKKTFSDTKSIGFSFNDSDINFADTKLKFLNQSNIFFSSQGSSKNLSYKLNIIKENNDTRLDDSFLKYYSNNKILTVGRLNQWWGPSDEISLILSNQSDPLPLISFENNLPFKINFIGNVNYKFFYSNLENNREIPNTKLIGARVEIQKNNYLLGLSRTAQFGGDNRPENFDTIKNIILGRDNTGNNDSKEPGNQLASVDVKYIFNNDTELHFQIAGEDESGYLPSRTFYNIGFKKRIFQGKVTFDHADTMSSSGINNYTYNHFLYKDGYRYRGQPLGAGIDADSRISILSYQKHTDSGFFYNLKYYSGQINENNSSTNYLSSQASDISGLSLDVIKNFKKYKISLRYGYFDVSEELSKNNISLRIEHIF